MAYFLREALNQKSTMWKAQNLAAFILPFWDLYKSYNKIGCFLCRLPYKNQQHHDFAMKNLPKPWFQQVFIPKYHQL